MMFEGRVSVITGASQGIGEAIARLFAREGATVVLVDIQPEKLDEVARSITADGGKALVQRADVSQLGQAAAVVEAVLKNCAKVDHLINNAGITKDNLFMRMREEEWDAVIAVNLKGVFNFSKAVIRAMIGARSGRIVNLASVVGVMGNAGQTNYAASKAGLVGYVRTQSKLLAPRGITVNGIAPGFIETRLTAAIPLAIREVGRRLSSLGQGGQPQDVAEAITFLATPAASGLSGVILRVCGGAFIGA